MPLRTWGSSGLKLSTWSEDELIWKPQKISKFHAFHVQKFIICLASELYWLNSSIFIWAVQKFYQNYDFKGRNKLTLCYNLVYVVQSVTHWLSGQFPFLASVSPFHTLCTLKYYFEDTMDAMKSSYTCFVGECYLPSKGSLLFWTIALGAGQSP